MAGVRFIIRQVMADIADNFDRADGPLSGSTPIGAKPWQSVGNSTAVAGTVSGRLRATSGTGNKMYYIDAGRSDYDMTYTIRDVRNVSVVPSAVFAALDDQNHWSVAHRADVSVPEYKIFRRLSGSLFPVLSTGVVPAPGDRVIIRKRGIAVELLVNDVSIGSLNMTADSDRTRVGFNMSGDDQVSAFDDLQVYLR